ncbi:MAG: hypothetical protein LBP60_09955, partial [Spirochaetaceae bacterium]|nr:hypothetical protein [Spirochaetaceae bacterium]
MASVITLMAGILLFSFFGVLWLLKQIRELKTALDHLRWEIRNLPDRPVQPLPAPAAEEAAPVAADAAAFTATAEAVPAAAVSVKTADTAERASGSGKSTAGIAAFIHSGNAWVAGGVLLLIAAFAMFITYMTGRGF